MLTHTGHIQTAWANILELLPSLCPFRICEEAADDMSQARIPQLLQSQGALEFNPTKSAAYVPRTCACGDTQTARCPYSFTQTHGDAMGNGIWVHPNAHMQTNVDLSRTQALRIPNKRSCVMASMMGQVSNVPLQGQGMRACCRLCDQPA